MDLVLLSLLSLPLSVEMGPLDQSNLVEESGAKDRRNCTWILTSGVLLRKREREGLKEGEREGSFLLTAGAPGGPASPGLPGAPGFPYANEGNTKSSMYWAIKWQFYTGGPGSPSFPGSPSIPGKPCYVEQSHSNSFSLLTAEQTRSNDVFIAVDNLHKHWFKPFNSYMRTSICKQGHSHHLPVAQVDLSANQKWHQSNGWSLAYSYIVMV